eukprot:scaffold1536_cov397-Prasinococcus_capsulatus_cf.AAC.18
MNLARLWQRIAKASKILPPKSSEHTQQRSGFVPPIEEPRVMVQKCHNTLFARAAQPATGFLVCAQIDPPGVYVIHSDMHPVSFVGTLRLVVSGEPCVALPVASLASALPYTLEVLIKSF